MLKGKKILIGITGGIAAYKICSLVRLFVKEGAEVRVLMTPSAVNFVSPLTLSVLSGNEVIINMFPETGPDVEKVDAKTWHINLGIWADIFVLAPATANSIAKINAGISDNFLLSVVLASRCPVLVVPTMDEDMYNNKITQGNIENLRTLGYQILEPVTGELASGLYGIGKMPEPENIFDAAVGILNRKPDLHNKKILVTAGPTREPIDSVRYISNYSSGRMGFKIAEAAADRGASVTLVTGPSGLTVRKGIKRIDVNTAEEMLSAVKRNIRQKDLVVMSAAVSDYSPAGTSAKKLKKEDLGDSPVINLRKSPDILEYLGKNKKDYKLIGFALETENGIENARKKLVSKNLDFIVLNFPEKGISGFDSETNKITVIDKKNIFEYPVMTKYAAGNVILDHYLKLSKRQK